MPPSPTLRERRTALLARHDLGGDDFCAELSGQTDDWLAGLAEEASGGDRRHLALLAVGGYGRGTLCPYSDLDLVLVHEGRRDVAAVADAIWYPIWDQGVKLDHSVRRPSEMFERAAEDLRVALGLLDGRLLWGDPQLAGPLLGRAVEEWRDRLGAYWLPALESQMAERHVANGEVAYLLEPDLKESHGGLRDLNVWRAVAQYAPQLSDHVDLAGMERGAAILTAVRVELHRLAGRAQDRLLLQDQDQVAAALGTPDADGLMATVASAGNTIAWGSDDAWRRRHLWQPPGSRRRSRLGGWRRRTDFRPPSGGAADGPTVRTQISRDVEPGIRLQDGEVVLGPDAAVMTDPALPLRLAAVAAESDAPIGRAALGRLADHAPAPPVPWPDEVRSALVRTLATGRPAIAAIRALDHYGLFVRILPAWEPVRNRPQRNAYHRFTVDRHLLETAANAALLAGGVRRTDLLLVGALLHDIGKGHPGDHTDVGIELVGTIGHQMGFSGPDVGVLQELVRHHLLLPDTATRRDLEDPRTIHRVASAVGDRDTLALLAALTEADSRATGPAAWGPWKAGLVRDLVGRTDHYLAVGEAPARRDWLTDADRQLMDSVRVDRRTAVRVEPPRVLVASPDRSGLLAAVAGVLALHGMGVRSADVTTVDGIALESFMVECERWPEAAVLEGDIGELLSRHFVLRDRLAAKARDYATARPTSARPVTRSVDIDNDASSTSTVVEVHAADEVGLLHRVTRTLTDCALDVVSARVATVGTEVVDAFYVRDSAGHKIEDPVGMRSVHDALARSIGLPEEDERIAHEAGRGATEGRPEALHPT